MFTGALAVLYVTLATLAGAELRRIFLPFIVGSGTEGSARAAAPWVIALPAAFLIGTLLTTCATYLAAWAFRKSAHPLVPANAIVMGMVTLWLAVRIGPQLGHRKFAMVQQLPVLAAAKWRAQWVDLTVAAIALIVGTAIMLLTCRVEGTTLVLGRTAFGDLNIHLGMARSFSYGNNFPTGYVAYAGNDIRYHFMFYFLVGNLEFLGLRLDWALNLPCILSFASVVLLLHGLGSALGRDRRVGALAVVFFMFRSSPTFFAYISRLDAKGFAAHVSQFLETDRFIAITPRESWGIWTLNIFVVERHFAFALGLVFLAVIYLVRASGLDKGPSLFAGVSDSTRTPVFDRD